MTDYLLSGDLMSIRKLEKLSITTASLVLLFADFPAAWCTLVLRTLAPAQSDCGQTSRQCPVHQGGTCLKLSSTDVTSDDVLLRRMTDDAAGIYVHLYIHITALIYNLLFLIYLMCWKLHHPTPPHPTPHYFIVCLFLLCVIFISTQYTDETLRMAKK